MSTAACWLDSRAAHRIARTVYQADLSDSQRHHRAGRMATWKLTRTRLRRTGALDYTFCPRSFSHFYRQNRAIIETRPGVDDWWMKWVAPLSHRRTGSVGSRNARCGAAAKRTAKIPGLRRAGRQIGRLYQLRSFASKVDSGADHQRVK